MFNDLAKQKKETKDQEKTPENKSEVQSASPEEKGAAEKKSDNLAIHTIPDRFLGKLDTSAPRSTSSGRRAGKRAGQNKALVVILIVSLVFLLLLAGVAFFFLQSVKKPVPKAPPENIGQQEETKKPLPVCSPFNCDLCSEEECKDFLDSCHVEESLENIDDEKVFVTKCVTGSQADYQKQLDEEEEKAREEEEADQGDEPEDDEPKNITPGNDFDNDGLTDLEEDLWGTDMSERDTDSDSFLDGLEVISLYDPTKEDGSRLTENFSLIQTGSNEEYGFNFIYPKRFTKIADSSNRILLQSDQTTEYFEISVLENVTNISLLENVFALYNPQNINDFIKYEDGAIEKISSSDKMIYYILNDDYIFQFYYSPSVDLKVNYMNTFQSLINSFEFINNPFSFEEEAEEGLVTGNEVEL